MKKTILSCICALMLMMVTALVACQEPGELSKPETLPPVSQGALLFVSSEGSDYAIMHGKNADEAELQAVETLRQGIKDLTGITLKVRTDGDATAAKKFILVGETNKKETRDIISDLYEDEYTVAVVNEKLVICGGSPEATVSAVEYFLELMTGKTSIIMEENYMYTNAKPKTEPVETEPIIPALGSTKLSVDMDDRHQTLVGLGASGAWYGINWSKQWKWESVEEAIDLMYNSVTGYGLNGYRYNIGGGNCDGSWNMPKAILMEKEHGSGVVDIFQDQDGLRVLNAIMEYDLENLVLFWNSPPYYMTKNGYSNGSSIEYDCNLKEEYYEAFADYVVNVADAFVKEGYPVRFVSPFNEPQNAWIHGPECFQEGCYYTSKQVIQIGEMIAKRMLDRNAPYQMTLAESATWANREYTIDMAQKILTNDFISQVTDHLSGHSYWTGEAEKKDLKKGIDALKRVYQKKDFYIYQSEWDTINDPYDGLHIDSGLSLARVLYEDFTILNCPRWDFWASVTGSDLSTHYIAYIMDNGMVQSSKRGWVLGHYGRFCYGAERVSITMSQEYPELYATAWHNEDKNELYIILANEAEGVAHVNMDQWKGCTVDLYRTTMDDDLKQLDSVVAGGDLAICGKSIHTLVIHLD